ncbi:MAG: putative response-associated peptidase YedK [Bacteroidota bacterium]|jgi:hypothetical protein
MKIEKLYSNTELTFYKPICETSIKISLVSSRINAGFPSPAMDFAEEQIDLNEELIKNPYSTFFVRVVGESMRNAGIYNGDSLNTEAKKLENRFKAELKNKYVYKPIFHANGFDFPKWSVITTPGIIDSMSWGLIPNWVKDSTKINEYRSKTLNARSETAFELPSFKSAIQSNRCLVLSNGFYEWMTFNKQKYPHYIHLKDNEPFAMVGILTLGKTLKQAI